MDQARSKKIDDLLTSVKSRTEARQAEREAKPEITWDSFSPESQEVLAHFGLEAPHKLNVYVCSVEDALIETVGKLKDAHDTIKELKLKVDSDS